MGEILLSQNEEELERDDTRPLLRSVSMEALPEETIIPPEEDETGKIITPAIVIEKGCMPNGQSIESFYARGNTTPREAYWKAIRATGRAARIALEITE